MEQFMFRWQESAVTNRITPRWVAKVVLWSVITAYLPNIIWYFTGYPLNAVMLQFMVVTFGLPPVVFLSMRAYRKHFERIKLECRMRVDGCNIVITKEELSESSHRYISVWKASRPSACFAYDKPSGELSIDAMFHMEAYIRKRDGTKGRLVASDWKQGSAVVKAPEETWETLQEYMTEGVQ